MSQILCAFAYALTTNLLNRVSGNKNMFKFDRTPISRQLNLEIIFILQNLTIREDNLSPYQCLLKSTHGSTVFF